MTYRGFSTWILPQPPFCKRETNRNRFHFMTWTPILRPKTGIKFHGKPGVKYEFRYANKRMSQSWG